MRILLSLAPWLLFACKVVPAASPASSSGPAPGGGDPAAPAEGTLAPAGSVSRPGGDLSRESATCDAAHDHCLREGTWFAMRASGDDDVHPVFLLDGRWYDWDSLGEIAVISVYQTRAATAADLQPGATVVFYKGPQDPRSPPKTESGAYIDWRIDTVAVVDAAAGTFEWGTGSMEIPIDNARVIVETR